MTERSVTLNWRNRDGAARLLETRYTSQNYEQKVRLNPHNQPSRGVAPKNVMH